ncbi:hypothetical protein CYMTET_11885 [Cymbomonas tetramitiformis]|uniref:G-patch domain-containing protein n=1 Tax=Cymbomonas tetramitiformis TaxID=36881 RepID=A0AAE0GLP8_9CHLO|nr:hypothetical protein CYMTET_11885 [Cymbomonas tetramitiformis]
MSDDEQHNERLDMNNDYEDAQFIEGEFFHGGKKEKRKWTKEDTIYGVFNEGDSDDEKGGRRGRSHGKSKTDYTEGVAFVNSGEVVQKQPEEDAPGLGLGAGLGSGTGGGLGFQGPVTAPASAFVKADAENDDEEMELDEDSMLPTAFGQRIQKMAGEKQKKQKAENRSVNATKSAEALRSSGIGTFEAHTKGIGAKLLAKMGYTGKGGLGKSETGMAKAIEVTLRPRGAALGHSVDVRKRTENTEEKPEKPEDEQAKKPAPAVKMWKQKNQEKRTKATYKTAAELLAEQEDKAPAPQTTVIDMRGAQARVVTNMANLNALEEEESKEDPVPMPELQHNMRLIVDMSEAEIKQLDSNIYREKENAVILGREQDKLRKEVAQRSAQVERAQELLNLVLQCQSGVDQHSQTLEDLAVMYSDARARFPEEYVMYKLRSLALAQVQPLMSARFAGWSPLAHPDYGVDLMSPWKGLLEDEGTRDAIFSDPAAEGDAYCRLVQHTVVANVRTCMLNQWEPRDPEPALKFFEAWERVLPLSIRHVLLEQLVMPKLQMAVDGWDPRQEQIPIHSWLHPWLPYLAQRLEPLYAPIRYRLATCLQQWHPGDGSALALLGPWQQVFSAMDWEQLLVRSILPKLQWAMQELVINPRDQHLDQFNWVLAWKDAAPVHHLVNILETIFFPKFQQVLYTWLTGGTPNYDEVTQWYLGWKSMIPENLLAHERVRHCLNSALDMMNQSVAGAAPMPQPAPPIPPSGAAMPPPMQAAPELPTWQAPQELSFKDLVERFAEQHDVLFLPKGGRTHEGLQVYGFGPVSVVLDNSKQVLLVQTGDRWAAMSLDGLLQEFRKRTTG